MVEGGGERRGRSDSDDWRINESSSTSSSASKPSKCESAEAEMEKWWRRREKIVRRAMR